jgi:hypothetical protein
MSVCLTGRAGQGRAGLADIFSYWPLSSSSANSKQGRVWAGQGSYFHYRIFLKQKKEKRKKINKYIKIEKNEDRQNKNRKNKNMKQT